MTQFFFNEILIYTASCKWEKDGEEIEAFKIKINASDTFWDADWNIIDFANLPLTFVLPDVSEKELKTKSGLNIYSPLNGEKNTKNIPCSNFIEHLIKINKRKDEKKGQREEQDSVKVITCLLNDIFCDGKSCNKIVEQIQRTLDIQYNTVVSKCDLECILNNKLVLSIEAKDINNPKEPELQLAAALLCQAKWKQYSNLFDKNGDIEVYGLTIVGYYVTFYKSIVTVSYLNEIKNGDIPNSEFLIKKYPSLEGLSLINPTQRLEIIKLLYCIKETVQSYA